mmetsp:Transcript_16193/g.33754  ORF Transcript_16193/g.33754 Transcript_16193/m.33754 type:complete len:183 (-) Transcript_16193:72-620(-)
MVPLPEDPEGGATGAARATPVPRERLDLDPERPSFLLLEQAAGVGGNGGPEQQPKKPRIGPVESSSVLLSARAFLSAAAGRDPAEGLSPGGCDPEIARAAPAEVQLPGGAAEAEGPPADEGPQHVQMDLSLGVFDVAGSTEALERRGVPVATGQLPADGESSDDDSSEEAPLIQEVPNVTDR